jgi:uncharacterized protein YecT (DUF1311 family)
MLRSVSSAGEGQGMAMRLGQETVLAAGLVLLFVTSRVGALVAQDEKPTPEDRAAVAACLDRIEKNRAAEAARPGFPPAEESGASGRLKAAAADAASTAESCIGAVANACAATPEGQSTPGMIDCSARELAVWDERLNKAYRDSIAAAAPKLREALRQAQRAWIAYRDARCALPALENADGTIVGPLTSACLMEATARQALWLSEER